MGKRTTLVVATGVLLVGAVLTGASLAVLGDGGEGSQPGGSTSSATATGPGPSGGAVSPGDSPSAPGAATTSAPSGPVPSGVPSAAPSGGPAAPSGPTTGPHPTAPPVALDATATPARGVTAVLRRLQAVEVTAQVPGDVGGPGLAVTVAVTNDTDAPLDLTTAVVNLAAGRAREPALPIDSESRPLAGVLAPGATATGRYAFRVDRDERGHVEVEVDLGVALTVVVFAGPAPR
jgi:hypothetical protein